MVNNTPREKSLLEKSPQEDFSTGGGGIFTVGISSGGIFTYIRRAHDFKMATSKGVASGKSLERGKGSLTNLFLAERYNEFKQFAVILAKAEPQQHIGRCQLHNIAELSTPVDMRGGQSFSLL
jgi:hypothetical protein